MVITYHPKVYSYDNLPLTGTTFVIRGEEVYNKDVPILVESGGITSKKVISTDEMTFVDLIDDVSKEQYNEYDIACYCVTYLREIKGLNIRGDANTIKANIDHPVVGGVVLFNYNGDHHASLINAILPNGNMILHEANYERCQINTDRVVTQSDPAIRGYFFSNPNAIERR